MIKKSPTAVKTRSSTSQFEKVVDLEPNNWQSHYNLATSYLEQGCYEAGKKELKVAFSLEKNFLVGFSLIRFFFLRNTIWVAVLVFAINLLALKLPWKYAIPLILLLVGYQICAALSCFICKRMGSGVLNLLVSGLLLWFFGVMRMAP